GTAVLGLGDIGPEASKPVMEGKALLFKIFAGIDVFDIEIDAKDTEKFIETVKNISPTFGGINLEDIKAPEAFEIEKRLSEELDIPVMHDDQHGTAIISSAALLNALDLVEKKIEDVQMVVCGAGAAAISCARMYKAFGLNPENIVMTDSKGVIRKDRKELSCEKAEFATSRDLNSLDQAMIDADIFIGLSRSNMVNPGMLLSMAKNPIVFAMANPDPEIEYSLAMKTRDDIIMATGRSDHPNQVNNVLGFPFIFRGALDVKATKINDQMKMAAVKALASLAKESVPEFVNIAYDKTKLTFGKNYIIPKPFDPRLITKIPPMVAKAAMDSGVALEPIECWDKYEEELHNRLGSDKKIVRFLTNRAKTSPKRIIYAEADHLDVLKAAQIVHEEGIGFPILLGNREVIEELKKEIEFDEDLPIIDPKSKEEFPNREKYGKKYWEMRKRKGVTYFRAVNKMKERNLFAAMMIYNGDADALISGYSRSYPVTVKPIFEVIGRSPGVNKVATTNLMITSKGPLFLSDTSINIDPSSKDLAIIAKMTSDTVKMFGLEPNIAMVSYSNFGSSNHPMVLKVNEAVNYLHRNFPKLNVDGPVQSDFALNKEMLKEKFSFSKLSGKNVNTLIFPNLDSANTNYKVIKELDNALSIGPIMMGMSKAVHVIQLGASVEEMVNMSAVAVVDAQKKSKIKK
ncbi:MAG: NADP-dependent malic enzyme, partial [Flavobacteriaceae bacterium]|nr:NADP-dependent malic enzyme [Flavobacteriaceae bacterium]